MLTQFCIVLYFFLSSPFVCEWKIVVQKRAVHSNTLLHSKDSFIVRFFVLFAKKICIAKYFRPWLRVDSIEISLEYKDYFSYYHGIRILFQSQFHLICSFILSCRGAKITGTLKKWTICFTQFWNNKFENQNKKCCLFSADRIMYNK